MVNAMNEEVLSQLKDLHVPNPPSWWPLPWGYYLVVLLLLLLGFIVWRLRRCSKKAHIKKLACRELELIEERFLANGDANQLQTELNRLVRRWAVFKGFASHSDLLSSIEYLWPNNKTNQQLVELLTINRFQLANTIDGQKLLALLREQFLCQR